MQIGVNWTSPHNAQLIKELIATPRVQFCEILIDNFLIYSPQQILDNLEGVPCSFHIMNSNFIFRDLKEIKEIGLKIRAAKKVLSPLYVSDHIGLFTYKNRLFPFMQELTYNGFFDFFQEKVKIWTDIMEMESDLHLENFASFELQEELRQVDFYRRIQEDLKGIANILFDFSNAVLAAKNGCEPLTDWLPISINAKHFHIAGYEKAGSTKYYLDSHNCNISAESLDFLYIHSEQSHSVDSTIVVERDFNLDYLEWLSDIKKVQEVSSNGLSYRKAI